MKPIIIDVREPYEYAVGHAEEAVNIPLSQLQTHPILNTLPKDTVIIAYCRSGARSASATYELQQLGFQNVTNAVDADMAQEYARNL